MKLEKVLLFRSKRLLLAKGRDSILRRLALASWTVSPVSEEALAKSLPFDQIPGPKALPLIGNMHRYLPGVGEYSTEYWHESQRAKFKKYGNIVKETFLPGISAVHLCDPKDMEAVTRFEGKTPQRDFFLGMKKLREERPQLYSTVGVAPGNGEEWYQMRSQSQKVLMRPQVMRQFIPQMNIIADEFVRSIRRLRDQDNQVPNLMHELFKWALESVIYILFNQRMGCLSEDLPPDSMALKYIAALNDFFLATGKVELTMVPIWRVFPSLSPSFKKLARVHNFFFENAMQYVKEAVQNMESSRNSENPSVMQSLLQYCKPEDAAVMAIDAMAAGIDTTSLSVAYVLYNLAKNPEAQRKLQNELDTVLPNGQTLRSEDIERVPYLRACIKESMRLTPTVQGTSRTTQRDIVLSGYRVPANTPMTLNYFISSVSDEYFPEAHKYKPERWLRDGLGDTKESFAFQPFGFGPRMCIGRRIADMEMVCLITKIMQNFRVENKQPDIDICFRLVLMIKSPLTFEFHERFS